MPIYEYRGIDIKGKEVKGIIEADNQRKVRQRLREKGIYLTEISEPKITQKLSTASSIREFLFPVTLEDRAIMTRQLATLLSSGVPLSESLHSLIEQTENNYLKKVISHVRTRVTEGVSLADALKEYPKVFSDVYVNMIRSGESSGTLDSVLLRLAEFLENQGKIRNRIRAALAYPILMLIVGTGILIFLMTSVIPKITRIFEDMGTALPLPTRILIGFSHITAKLWWIFAVLLIISIIITKRYIRTEKGRAFYDRISLRLPVFGRLVRIASISRIMRTLATLISSGVPLLTAIDIARSVTTNTLLSKAMESAKEHIKEGGTLSAPLRESGLFPPMVSQMIAIGEQTGELESMLFKISDAYENEMEMSISRLTSLLEPVMILFMGAIVAFVVFSILLPLFQANLIIK